MKKSRDMIALFLVCVLFLTACGKRQEAGTRGTWYLLCQCRRNRACKEEIQLKGTSAEEQVQKCTQSHAPSGGYNRIPKRFCRRGKAGKWELSDECVKLYFDDGYEKLRRGNCCSGRQSCRR